MSRGRITLWQRLRQRLSVFSLLLALTAPIALGCGSDGRFAAAFERLGLTDPPPLTPEVTDLLCDASEGSSCTSERLTATLSVLAPRAAERPGSRLRLWMMGATVGGTRLVAERVSPTLTGRNQRTRGKRAQEWAEGARDYLLLAATPLLAAKGGLRSPIAESLTKVALFASYGLARQIVVVTDGREVSGSGSFECRPLPTPAQWRRRLEGERVLAPGLLQGIRVFLIYVESLGTSRCPSDLARDSRIRELWQQSLTAAGAASVAVVPGPLVFASSASAEKE